MTSTGSKGCYDEALERFHRTGPEFEGWLSNHGPMVVEVLSRRGHHHEVHRWTDAYLRRLDEVPRGVQPINGRDWPLALGDPTRTGDWIALFTRALDDARWTEVLATWWPRLLPGIAAGATHGVIRTGHAVRGLREVESTPRVAELAHALAYWAARWQPLPPVRRTGVATAADLLERVPRVPRPVDGIRARLAQLGETPQWDTHVARLATPATVAAVPAALDALIDAAVAAYPRMAHGSPTMLVHAATAPNAVAATLPSLPQSRWRDSYDAVWLATAAIIAAYRPAVARPVSEVATTPEDVLARAVAHGGEHVVKFADVVLGSYRRTGSPHALTGAQTAIELDA